MTLTSGPEGNHASDVPGTDAPPGSALPGVALPARTPPAMVPVQKWTPVSRETLTRVRAALNRL
jgi:hypothetical protein